MEIQIQELVSSIKKDGIDAAKKEASQIIRDAKKEAGEIVANAKKQAKEMLEQQNKEIETYKENARASSEQAKRDAMLAFRDEISKEVKNLLDQNITKAIDEKLVARLILAVVKDEDLSKYALEINDVSEGLKKELADKIKAGLEIRLSNNVRYGFVLKAKDGSGYFDCSDKELGAMLSPFFRDVSI